MLRSPSLLVAATLFVHFAGAVTAQERIPWVTDLRQARQMAEQQQKLVLLHFWSESCPPCRLLEQNVFNQPELIRVMSTSFIPVKINVLQQPKIADFYKIDRVPMDVLVDPSGKELYRATSPQSTNGYLAILDQVRAQAGVHAERALEAIAQNPLQKMQSALPPMFNSDGDQLDAQSVNSDPTMLVNDVKNDLNAWKNSLQNDATTRMNDIQRTIVQNQFAINNQNNSNTPSGDPAPRQGNPYLDKSTLPIGQNGPPVETVSVQKPETGSFIPPSDSRNSDFNQEHGGQFNPQQYLGQTQTPPQTPSQQSPSWNGQQPQPGAPDPRSFAQQNPGQFQPGMQNAPGQQPLFGQQDVGQPSMPTQPQSPAVPQGTPAGQPPLALDGYCPVTLVQLSKWVKGDPRFGAIHRGRTYLLGSQSDQQRFLADPDRFAPALSGYDPVRFAETGQLVEGKREHGLFFSTGYYLFADEAALTRFATQPQGYVNVVKQAMANTRPNMPQR